MKMLQELAKIDKGKMMLYSYMPDRYWALAAMPISVGVIFLGAVTLYWSVGLGIAIILFGVYLIIGNTIDIVSKEHVRVYRIYVRRADRNDHELVANAAKINEYLTYQYDIFHLGNVDRKVYEAACARIIGEERMRG